MNAEDQRELRKLLDQLAQDVVDAKVMEHDGQLMRLTSLLNRMERRCHVASVHIFNMTDLYA